MMEPLLEVKDLTKHYDHFYLDNLSFTLPKGTIMGLIGSNGAGKSTTIKAILGLIKPSSGTVLLNGHPLNEKSMDDIGVVFDELSFYPGLTVSEIERICIAAYSHWDHPLFNDYMERFSLPTKSAVKTFSKGMKMKLSLAIALAHHPKLLILDEATSGLDPVVREDILDIFLEFVQDETHSILISSHISSDLEKICDYITYIDHGKLLLCHTKDHLIYDYGLIHCSEHDFKQLDSSLILRYRKEAYQYSVLVNDKAKARHRYPDLVMDDIHLDDLLLLYAKGASINEELNS